MNILRYSNSARKADERSSWDASVGAVALRRPGGSLKYPRPRDQIAKINSSNATASRRFTGSSTASS
jgi:hypothetical protein